MSISIDIYVARFVGTSRILVGSVNSWRIGILPLVMVAVSLIISNLNPTR